MSNLNNLYNFKNPIRHFLNLDNIMIPDNIDEIKIAKLGWTTPIKFRIKKDNFKFRVLKFPNILNFICAVKQFETADNFYDMASINADSRSCPNIVTGDFKANTYSENLELDFNRLCIYDNLIRVDIKSFYGRIYLHNLDLDSKENYINNMNDGKTNEIILGNYLSLYLAEEFLKKISDDVKHAFEAKNICFELSYFSDDFYIFCNKRDNNIVIQIFDEVLAKYDLERNEEKIEFWTYEEYSNYNLVEKYWKKIVWEDKQRFKKKDGTLKEGHRNFYFINQLIYRKSNLSDIKLQKVFINNFFKSTHFNRLEWEKYVFQEFNCHQLFSMYKFSPEILIYTIPEFRRFDLFIIKIKNFLKVRYNESLRTNFFEEQLYYFYALKTLGFDEIIKDEEDTIITGDNQILQSYYLMYDYFKDENIGILKGRNEEQYWFINYHLILYTDLKEELETNIKEYLVPKIVKGKASKEPTYLEFYKKNIENRISFICDIVELENNVADYINEKIVERESEEDELDDNDDILESYDLNDLGI